jgi:hypothetical protein
MPRDQVEYRFRIDAFSPETMPMERLAEYMAELAKLLGSQQSVHFVRLEPGSTVLVEKIEHEAAPKVRDRVNGVKHRDAPDDAIRAYDAINRKLREDNGSAFIETDVESEVSKVIEFPGRNRPPLEKFDSIYQRGAVDGVLIRVGGRDETVPVYLEEGKKLHMCNANRAVAKLLVPYLFSGMLRASGEGKWNRDDFGNWVMERFTIHDFKPLDETPLKQVVEKLRQIESPFRSMKDPLGEIKKLRSDGDN